MLVAIAALTLLELWIPAEAGQGWAGVDGTSFISRCNSFAYFQGFYSAEFNPGSPDGGITLVSPIDSATVTSTPIFTISNACTNCTSQFIALKSLADMSVEIDAFSDMLPYPSMIDFGDFGPNTGTLGAITELPPGDYDIELDTTVETVTQASFTPADNFTYFAATFREDPATIAVPEPEILVAQGCAGLTLLGLARSRHRS